MKKVVINACYGGFGLSAFAENLIEERTTGDTLTYYEPVLGTEMKRYVRMVRETAGLLCIGLRHDYGAVIEDINTIPDEDRVYSSGRETKRDDPLLISIIEEFGSEKCSGQCAQLSIVEIPDDVKWHVEEYDGFEHIAEDHKTWS